MKTAEQLNATDNYLKDAYMPVMHRMGIKQIGVFKPISNDTAVVKEIIVIVPYISLDVWQRTKSNILKPMPLTSGGAKAFQDADTSTPALYKRMESTIMEAFP